MSFLQGLPMQLFMSLLWVMVAWGPINADFNDTHLFNPDWPPHARMHMMTVFTTAVAAAVFGLYLVWGRTCSRLERLRLSAVLGCLYVLGLIAASLAMPLYGGSLYWDDIQPRAASLNDANLVVFLATGIIFLLLAGALFVSRDSGPAP
ncbi:MAG: DUF6640 family protein [Gammaproteobacteria bacterium]